MQNLATESRYQWGGIQSSRKSAFVYANPIDDPFSFKDVLSIFKKKEGNGSDKSQSSLSTKTGGTGIGAGIATGIIGLLGGLAPVLPALGVGSKSRIAETNALAAANTQIYNAQTRMTLAEQEKDNERTYLIVGVGVLLIIVVAVILFSRK